jgi:YVTN family beta-propeller protein
MRHISALFAVATFVAECLLGGASAQAQFFKQGPKLVDKGGKDVVFLEVRRLAASALGLMLALSFLLCSARAQPFAYITSNLDNNVTVIDISTSSVVGAPIPVGSYPVGVAVTPNGNLVYVANSGNGSLEPGTISFIDATTRSVGSIPVGIGPYQVAVTPNGLTAYVTNFSSYNISAIDTSTNTIKQAPISLGRGNSPYGIAITPDGRRAYVAIANSVDQTLAYVIDLTTDAVEAIPHPPVNCPFPGAEGVAITPDGRVAYVAEGYCGLVWVIDTATNAVGANPISVGYPFGIGVTPDGTELYVTSEFSSFVAVIGTDTNTVKTTITTGTPSSAVAFTPDRKYAYVANVDNNSVSVIDIATKGVVGNPIPAGGRNPVGIGIMPLSTFSFSGTPGTPNCIGKSVSALSQQYGALSAAAAALGYSSVQVLQNAIATYCAG